MKVAIGGERLGSGKKPQQDLRTYNRSTHNLSEDWASTMACGVLYPSLVKLVQKGDKWTIKARAGARTIPTKAPLFGSYKVQMDYFFCPMRLYQALLHNNPTGVGLKMKDVKFPMLRVFTRIKDGHDYEAGKFADNCLLTYLGMSGLGRFDYPSRSTERVARDILAIPALGYYEIFKTYYANKQEEDAYFLSADKVMSGSKVTSAEVVTTLEGSTTTEDYKSGTWFGFGAQDVGAIPSEYNKTFTIQATKASDQKIKLVLPSLINGTQEMDINNAVDLGLCSVETRDNEIEILFDITSDYWQAHPQYVIMALKFEDTEEEISDLRINTFKLSNIDQMRMRILSDHQMGHTFLITRSETLEPYKSLVQLIDDGTDHEGVTKNSVNFNGLCLKTYQSDIYNQWVNTEWIDGENGIAELTKIAVSDGGIYVDSINLSEKLYNVMNRIAVSDGTFESWEDVVYTETKRQYMESPIYLGGSSDEIVFQEIIQTAPGEDSALGTLGGRGELMHRKGGNVYFTAGTAGFIIGIISITPRIYYTQGNEFYMTEIQSMDDIHKPALDGIGFQNLIGERMAWFDTELNGDGTIKHRTVVGKSPAWLDYMTSVNKAYGDFRNVNGAGTMILNRHYDMDNNGDVKDFTTYIDPSKYNYAFAYAGLDAQNFWVQIQHQITARRLISAKQIPNV